MDEEQHMGLEANNNVASLRFHHHNWTERLSLASKKFKQNKITSSKANTLEITCGGGERAGCNLNRIRASSFNKRTKNRNAIDTKYRC